MADTGTVMTAIDSPHGIEKFQDSTFFATTWMGHVIH